MAPGLDEFDVLLEVVLSLVRVDHCLHHSASLVMPSGKPRDAQQ